jgi:YbbR domain-containing protein
VNDWLRSNTSLKLVAVIVAIVMWIFVHGITSETRFIEDVPLTIRIKPGLSLIHQGTARVAVTLRGTREDVRQVQRGDLAAVLDLSHEDRVGQDLPLRLTPKMVKHPPHVRVAEVAPASVTVRIDQIVEQEFTVQPQLTGEPMPGYSVERVLVRPVKVRLKGPKSQFGSGATVETLPVDLTSRRASFREWVELQPFDPNAGPKERRWVEVDVRLTDTPPEPKGKP